MAPDSVHSDSRQSQQLKPTAHADGKTANSGEGKASAADPTRQWMVAHAPHGRYDGSKNIESVRQLLEGVLPGRVSGLRRHGSAAAYLPEPKDTRQSWRRDGAIVFRPPPSLQGRPDHELTRISVSFPPENGMAWLTALGRKPSTA